MYAKCCGCGKFITLLYPYALVLRSPNGATYTYAVCERCYSRPETLEKIVKEHYKKEVEVDE